MIFEGIINQLKVRQFCLSVSSVLENCYILILILSLIVVISVMISNVLVPKLGSSRPILKVTSIDSVTDVADYRKLNNIFKTSSAGGEKLFANVCESCHSIKKAASHKVGPNLWDVAFSKIASAVNFRYSSALAKFHNYRWSIEVLNGFIKNPNKCAPGTYMSFSGLKDPFERMRVLRYLLSQADYPLDITELKFKT
ncbi:MAG: c-type cytochrome [Candidatus Hodgkinia cicadicola]